MVTPDLWRVSAVANTISYLGCGFKYVFFLTTIWGRFPFRPIINQYFSDGLKPPTSYKSLVNLVYGRPCTRGHYCSTTHSCYEEAKKQTNLIQNGLVQRNVQNFPPKKIRKALPLIGGGCIEIIKPLLYFSQPHPWCLLRRLKFLMDQQMKNLQKQQPSKRLERWEDGREDGREDGNGAEVTKKVFAHCENKEKGWPFKKHRVFTRKMWFRTESGDLTRTIL